MNDRQIHYRVFGKLFASCPPIDLGPVDPACGDLRAVPDFPGSLLAALADEFTEAELVLSGVGRRDAAGNLLINPALAPSLPVFALRESADAPPFNLLTNTGCVLGDGLPLLESLRDYRIANHMFGNEPFELLLCVDLVDLAILNSMGLPAASASGLDRIEPTTLAELCERFGWQRRRARTLPQWSLASAGSSGDELREEERNEQADDQCDHEPAVRADTSELDANNDDDPKPAQQQTQEPDTKAKPQIPALVFMNCHLRQWSAEPRPELETTRNFIGGLANNLDLELNELGEWRPNPETLERVRFCLEYGDAETAASVLADSIDLTGTLFIDADEPTPVPPTLWEAHAKLNDARKRGLSADLRQELYDDLVAAAERELFEPLLSRALNQRDPLRRSLAVHLASQMRKLHMRNFLDGNLSMRRSAENLEGDLARLRESETLTRSIISIMKIVPL